MVATKNITDLNSLTTLAADDILLIVDRLSSTSTEAKQITWANVQEVIQDIVGSLATDTTTLNFTYDDANATLTAVVKNNTSTQKSIFHDGTTSSTRQEGRFVDGVGINVEVADNSNDDRADITVKNTGVVNAENNSVTGTAYEFLSAVTVESDGSKTLEIRPLKIGNGGLSATYTDSNNSLTLDIDASTIDINDLDTTNPLAVSVGGTGANNPDAARTNLGVAKSGANTDISAISGLTTALTVSQGGTGDNTASGALKNLLGLNSAVGVGASGEQVVYKGSDLVSGSYRCEFKGIKSTSHNYITVGTEDSDIALGANPNTILDGISGTRNIGGARISNAATPLNSADLATKSYVDAQTTGLDIKESVRAATTSDLAATYASAGKTLTANSSGVISVDGEALSLDDRLLVKDQATGSENGIYTVTTIGTVSTVFVITRATDFDGNSEASAGAFTYVEAGTANSGKSYVQTVRNVVLDNTALTFSVFGESAIGTNSLANNKLQQVSEATIKGRADAVGTGNVTDLSADQLITILNTAATNKVSSGRVDIDISVLAPKASPTFEGTVTIPTGASIAGFAKLAGVQAFIGGQSGAVYDLTDNVSGAVTIDFALANNFKLQLTGTTSNTRSLGNPANAVAGQSGIITIVQSGTGSNLLSYESNWDLAATVPSISATGNAVDTLAYYCISSTKIRAVIVKD